MTHLVVFIDQSGYSQSVCDHAVWIAEKTGASVELVHIIGRKTEAHPIDYNGNLTLGVRTSLLQELAELDEKQNRIANQTGRVLLETMRDKMRRDGIDNVTIKLHRGDLLEALAESERDADLVIIGKRGEAADFAKMHLGSNVERVARASKKPVLVTSRSFKLKYRFMIAFDGGESAAKAVNHVAKSKLFPGMECHLLQVSEKTNSKSVELVDAENLLTNAGYTVVAQTLSGQPEKVISEKIKNEDIDLLIMGAYGHSRIRNLIIGSTTTEMLRSCLVPVMLFR